MTDIPGTHSREETSYPVRFRFARVVLVIAATLAAAGAAYAVESYHRLADLTGDGLVPPVQTGANGRWRAHWVGNEYRPTLAFDTLEVVVEFSGLEGAPTELRVYEEQPSGRLPDLVLLRDGDIESGTVYQIEGALVGDDFLQRYRWAALATTAHPDGEIAGETYAVTHLASCGHFVYLFGGCYYFFDYDRAERELVVHELPWTDPRPVFLEADYTQEPSSCSRYHYDLLNVQVSPCPTEDLGCGRFVRDNIDYCHTFSTPDGGFYSVQDLDGVADYDSLHIWGVVNHNSRSVCLYDEDIYVDKFEQCGDSLYPVLETSWGSLKKRFSKD
ncbi:MAG: CHRD domain-containing protein [Candidatus Eisenbacteria bacterium]|uniref:CHRD domain-containing protein n=1 Tax=Eiseniibacteriota bacterium TaxID=2212470 RepID=A0A956M008_UNCEI|nr:CHRD domain-containing protein [Candidatus Eisenbacteria bacterium]